MNNTTSKSQIVITDKAIIEIKGVNDIINYNSEEILLELEGEKLTLKGLNFNVKKVDTETKSAEITGNLTALYFNSQTKNKKIRFSSLFK